jgi:FAD:protein FMN transferase
MTLRYNRSAWLAASAVLGSALPASAETYLTEAQALGVILGESATPRREDHVLDDALRAKLEHDTNLKFPERSHSFFVTGQPHQPQKYAIVMNEIGKTEPITFMVGLSDQGRVSEVVIMVFRENRGWEVKEKRFLNQFRGKTIRNSIRVDEDIINYTGATLSSKAVARGVKRALALFHALYLGDARRIAASADGFAGALHAGPVTSVVTGESRLSLFRQMHYSMGTACEVRLWSDRVETAQRAFRLAFAEIRRLEQIFSAYRDDSELAHVNREAGRHAVAVSGEFFELTRSAKQFWRESDGACDITLGPLIRLWGLRSGEPRQPSSAELDEVRGLLGCDKLELNSVLRTVRFRRPGMELDFGGLAKGYAAQWVANQLHSIGVVSALLNLGKSSLSATLLDLHDRKAHVERETGIPLGSWLTGVTHPDHSQSPPIYIVLRPGESLSTSGTCERQFIFGTATVSHFLDPRTAQPVSGRRSATAITRSGPYAEVLAKRVLLAAPQQGESRSPALARADWIVTNAANSELELDFNLHRAHYLERT